MQVAPRSTTVSPTGFPVQRGHARARLNLRARLVTFSGTHPCTVVDLSCTGARIASAQAVRVGATVVVDGIASELFGTIVWAEKGCFGMAFEIPLPLAEVVTLRGDADRAPEHERRASIEYARRWVQGGD